MQTGVLSIYNFSLVSTIIGSVIIFFCINLKNHNCGNSRIDRNFDMPIYLYGGTDPSLVQVMFFPSCCNFELKTLKNYYIPHSPTFTTPISL